MLVSLVVILAATLTPQAFAASGVQEHWCLTCSGESVADAIANLLLFVPLGLATGLLMARRSSTVLRVVVIGFGISSAIEVIQFLGLIQGRYASLLDVAFNSTGALLGGVLALAAPTLLHPSERGARRLFMGWAVALHVLLFASAWALGRSTGTVTDVPRLSSLPHTTGFGWFEQPVVSATVDGAQFERREGSGAIIVTASQRPSHMLSVRVQGRDRRTTFVPMLFVHHVTDSAPHAMIGQRGSAFGLQVATNAVRAGLRMPLLTVDGVRTRHGDKTEAAVNEAFPVELHAAINRKEWTLSARRGSSAELIESAVLRIRPSIGWMLLAPIRDANGTIAIVCTPTILMVLWLPLFYWARGGIAHRLGALVAAVIVALSGLIVPAVWAGLALPTAIDLVGLIIPLLLMSAKSGHAFHGERIR
jgi:hypothetical protein